ncbi:hypothetical protein BD310DRAFT_953310 [Dichomitus squalens]|uniref:Uncharacterized protein n=1 Tax=Dichomitus squalens TaxID=114155 RepID=A0A4Q9PEF7_9APHY|nr:hypothetical protein BD310DRAFT_953310 [Dichomitus squalens]
MRDCAAELCEYFREEFENDTPPTESTTVNTAFKRVDQKVHPVAGFIPEEVKVSQRFPENPLDSLPPLSPIVPDFTPTAKLTQERIDKININKDGFLWPEEEKLFLHILKLNEKCIAFEDKDRGTLREDYFSPYIMPVVPHEAWKLPNIPIPPGIKEKVIKIVREKIAAGVYEPRIYKLTSRVSELHDVHPSR